MKEISVIVPVYKVEPYLRRCVDSILAQTFKNFELILVDDGSPDNCPAICDEYAQKDERIRVVHKKNGGISSARNTGMAVARGKYFLFCDSDDYVSPQWCACLYEQIKKNPNASIFCNLIRIDDSEKLYEFQEGDVSKASKTDYYQAYLMGLSAYVWNKIYVAEKIKKYQLHFCEKENIFEDVDFNLQYLKYCDDYIYLSQQLYAYVQRTESIMHTYEPDWLAMHLFPFYGRIPFIGKENLAAYCDSWLYLFLNLFPNIFDERNSAPWIKKIFYNQRALSSKEFQFCLKHASGKNENPIVLKILKTKNYLLYWLFEKAVNVLHKK